MGCVTPSLCFFCWYFGGVFPFLPVFFPVLSAVVPPVLGAWHTQGMRCLCQTHPHPQPRNFPRALLDFVACLWLFSSGAVSTHGRAEQGSPGGSIPLGLCRGSRGIAGEETQTLPVPRLGYRDSEPWLGLLDGCLKRRLERHPGLPREGDVALYPAEFPFLLHLLPETHRREQPVHSACRKEIDLEVTHCMKLL